MHTSIIGCLIPTRFFLQLSLEVWEMFVMFHDYRIYGLRFDSANTKNLVIESYELKKLFSCIS